ncbi:hypothetical protein [Microbacterium shaanxiense]
MGQSLGQAFVSWGLAPLLELNVIEPEAAPAAIDQHVDQLFRSAS